MKTMKEIVAVMNDNLAKGLQTYAGLTQAESEAYEMRILGTDLDNDLYDILTRIQGQYTREGCTDPRTTRQVRDLKWELEERGWEIVRKA